MMEEWRDIAGYEGLYQVSNMGRIKSLERVVSNGRGHRIIPETIRVPTKGKAGYLAVTIWKQCKAKTFSVHRIVAQAFIPNADNLPDVNHKDEDKTNNVFSNLEWCDKKYNNNYGTRKQRANEAQRKKKVLQYDLNGNFIQEHNGVGEAARAIRKPDDASSITKCCQGKLKYSHGFIWKFKEVT